MQRTLGRVLVSALALALGASATASAASTKPAVTTGAAADVTVSTATLAGSLDPGGAKTTFFFQYGTNSLYGAQTGTGTATGTVRRGITLPVAGLAPATTYHYRLVAQNRNGLVKGADRTFKTRPQPLALTLAANPNPVLFGAPVTLAGQLTGTGGAGRQVALQSNPFPYTQGFQNAANPQVTDPQGSFAFPLLSVPINTQYRVVLLANPAVVSPTVSLGVAVRLTTHVSSHHVRRGGRVRFSGVVRPARDGAQIAIQKLRGKRWVTVAGTITHHGGTTFSRYSKRVRIRRGGTYRVYVGIVDGNFVSNTGTHMHLRTHR